jgi:DNA-binding SARP family transcriptional activator
MNEILQFRLLGQPQITWGGQPLNDFTTRKAQALLIYLASTGYRHSREKLAGLFWPDMPDGQALKNLRTILPGLRQLVGPYLIVTREAITFDQAQPYWLDVEVLRKALENKAVTANMQQLWEVIALYQEDFLAGWYVRRAPQFEEWMLMEREQLRRLVVRGLTFLTERCLNEGNEASGLRAVERLLQLEPWLETAHQQRMRLLARMGQRGAALNQYETCRQILADEFGIEPMPETMRLAELIKLGEFREQAEGDSRGWVDKLTEHNIPQPRSETRGEAELGSSLGEPQIRAVSAGDLQAPIISGPRIDWGDMPRATKLYGRQQELDCLRRWLTTDPRQVVAILGIGGQGKTALGAALVRALVEGQVAGRSPQEEDPPAPFKCIIWRSLRNAPPLANVLSSWLSFVSDQQALELPDHLDEQLELLLTQLRRQRCLLVLDDVESILKPGERAGNFCPGYEGYGHLLQRLHDSDHQSCLILTSREYPQGMDRLAADEARVQVLHLGGISVEAGQELLRDRGVLISEEVLQTLVQRYAGSPLALKLVARTIQELYAGAAAAFLDDKVVIFGELREILGQQRDRLSSQEQELVSRLARQRRPVTVQTFWDELSGSFSKGAYLDSLQSLRQRSLLERRLNDSGLALPKLFRAYVAEGSY